MTSTTDPAVLVVGNFLSAATGVRGVGEDLAERLAGRGWAVATASRHRSAIARGLDMVLTTRRQLTRVDLASVELYSGRAFLWGEAVTAILRAARKPHVVALHGGGLPEFAIRRPRRVARVLAGASAVAAPSPYLARSLKGFRGEIEVIPNGLDLQDYPFEKRIEPKPQLVWLRAMHQVYQPVVAVEAVAKLVERFPEISLLMIGPDKNDGSLAQVQTSIERLGLQERVRIQGAVPKYDVPTWLNRGDIFLNTSQMDNAPVSLVEPMACGLCVVTTGAGGIPDMVQDGFDALVVPVGDADAMAQAIARVLDDPGLAARLSSNARASTEKYDWDVVLPKWEDLFRGVARDE